MITRSHAATVTAGAALLLAGAAIAQQTGQAQQQTEAQRGATQQQGQTGTTQQGQAGASAKGQTGAAAQGTRQARAEPGAIPVVMVLVPVKMASTAQDGSQAATRGMAEGCWVRLHGRQNFGGDTLTLVGPVDMPTMTGPFGFEWDDKLSSIEVGPKATVTLYGEENFRRQMTQLQPGRKVADLRQMSAQGGKGATGQAQASGQAQPSGQAQTGTTAQSAQAGRTAQAGQGTQMGQGAQLGSLRISCGPQQQKQQGAG